MTFSFEKLSNAIDSVAVSTTLRGKLKSIKNEKHKQKRDQSERACMHKIEPVPGR